MSSFTSVSLKALEKPLSLVPYLTDDLEIITAMLWLHPGHNFKVLGISHLFKLKKVPGFDSRNLVNLFL